MAIVSAAPFAYGRLASSSIRPPASVPPSEPPGRWPDLDPSQWVAVVVLLGAPLILAALWFADVIRPGSPARAGLRAVKAHPWWVWLAAAGLVFLSGQFVAAVVYTSLGVPTWMSPPLKAQVVTHAAMGIGGIAAGAALVRLLKAAAPQAGVTPRWSDLPVGLWAFVVAYPILLAVSALAVRVSIMLRGTAPDPIAHDTLRMIAGSSSDPWVWAMRAIAVLLIPVFEELIYRVGLQSAILRATGRPWTSVLVTSAIFTAAHASVMPPHAMAVVAALSVAMGLAYERTKRLGVPVVMHALFNLVNVAIAAWP